MKIPVLITNKLFENRKRKVFRILGHLPHKTLNVKLCAHCNIRSTIVCIYILLGLFNLATTEKFQIYAN